jgi:hypothetical protein
MFADDFEFFCIGGGEPAHHAGVDEVVAETEMTEEK